MAVYGPRLTFVPDGCARASGGIWGSQQKRGRWGEDAWRRCERGRDGEAYD